jgi:hypothetical protein
MRGAVQVGQRFGRLVVIDPDLFAPPAPSQTARGIAKGNRHPLCRCDCGTELQVKQFELRTGGTTSCGCRRREASSARATARNYRHGLKQHLLYSTWSDIIRRCENPRFRQYKDYGGRGIRVCERWHDIRLFIEDIERYIGPRPDGMTLDRIDNDGNYEPGNMRWATRKQQAANRRDAS